MKVLTTFPSPNENSLVLCQNRLHSKVKQSDNTIFFCKKKLNQPKALKKLFKHSSNFVHIEEAQGSMKYKRYLHNSQSANHPRLQLNIHRRFTRLRPKRIPSHGFIHVHFLKTELKFLLKAGRNNKRKSQLEKILNKQLACN